MKIDSRTFRCDRCGSKISVRGELGPEFYWKDRLSMKVLEEPRVPEDCDEAIVKRIMAR